MNLNRKRRNILRIIDDSDSDSESNISESYSEICECDRYPCNNNGTFCRTSRQVTHNQVETTNFMGGTSELWYEDFNEIADFHFDSSLTGIANHLANRTTPIAIFNIIWSSEIMDLIISCTNKYGKQLLTLNRPHTRNCRIQSFKETDIDEMKKFFALCLLQSQVKSPKIRSNWSNNLLYYHPIFGASMSGRRFEQILRCLNCEPLASNDRLSKISALLNLVNRSFQGAYKPGRNLSLDESMMLHRGKLSFRQFIKSKKYKFGIKFYELCTNALNLEIYGGKLPNEPSSLSVLDSLVIRLMAPYLSKGHSLFMDNYYNRVGLSNQLLNYRTHTTGTLRINRKKILRL